MMNAAAAAATRNRPPFTASQWQELEQQALVFKYMVSGTPIPPDLIYSIKRSLDSSISSRLFAHHPGVGWGCFEMGFGRKIDPEPGRCRRTDGKKWRCSKEAYPDSKYCEKHMHRGRNRSRKPVEVPSSTSSIITTNTSQAISSSSSSYNSLNRGLCMMSNNPNNNHLSSISSSSFPFSDSSSSSQYPYQNSSLNPFFYTHSSSSSSRPPDSDFSSSNTTHQLFLDSGSYSQDEKDYRNIHVDERAFFPEASGSARSFPDSYHHHLSMSSYNKSYSNSHLFQSLNENDSNHHPRHQQEEEQHCFVLGTDFKSPRPNKSEKEANSTETTQQRPLHHFFGDQWTQKNTDSWLDLASNSRIHTDE